MLDIVTARFTATGVPAVRYDAGGTPSSITVPFRQLRFSSDAKRKTSAYDRIGVTCASGFVRSPDVMLESGDILTIHAGAPQESKYLIGKLVSEEFNYPVNQVTEWVVEAILCNVTVTVKRHAATLTSTVTGLHSRPAPTTPFSSIPASLISAEYFETNPSERVKDQYLIRLPQQLVLNRTDILEVSGADLEHTDYQVQWIEPDSLGFTTYRVGQSRTV